MCCCVASRDMLNGRRNCASVETAAPRLPQRGLSLVPPHRPPHPPAGCSPLSSTVGCCSLAPLLPHPPLRRRSSPPPHASGKAASSAESGCSMIRRDANPERVGARRMEWRWVLTRLVWLCAVLCCGPRPLLQPPPSFCSSLPLPAALGARGLSTRFVQRNTHTQTQLSTESRRFAQQ